MKFDLHVHTRISPCSKLTPEEILRHVRLRGLDGVCITDHNSMNIRHFMTEGLHADGLCVIFGMEYDTPDGDFLLFGPFENLKPGMPVRRLLQTVAASGGVAVAAHPLRRSRPVREFIFRDGLCNIVENRNGRNTPDENLQVDFWVKKYGLTCCAGSDAHSLSELGRMVTCFASPITSRLDLIQALTSGQLEACVADAA